MAVAVLSTSSSHPECVHYAVECEGTDCHSLLREDSISLSDFELGVDGLGAWSPLYDSLPALGLYRHCVLRRLCHVTVVSTPVLTWTLLVHSKL